MTTTFVTLIERNDWEGETWRFFIPTEGNEEAIAHLLVIVEQAGDAYELDTTPLAESTVDALVKQREVGYLYSHERLHGRLVIPEIDTTQPHWPDETLYKGGVRGWMNLHEDHAARTPVYLYGHGRKRHIAAGEPTVHGGAAFCGDWHASDAGMVAELVRWNRPERVEQLAQRRRELPVCKRCQTGWDKREAG